MDELTLTELCDLTLVLHAFDNTKEGMYDVIEPYLMSKVGNMSERNLLTAL
jgi:hypothetical protein